MLCTLKFSKTTAPLAVELRQFLIKIQLHAGSHESPAKRCKTEGNLSHRHMLKRYYLFFYFWLGKIKQMSVILIGKDVQHPRKRLVVSQMMH